MNMVERLVGTDENYRRIANVDSCFGISGTSLQSEGRVLVGEGVLKKMCRKKLKPRQMFLFNDILVYGSIVIKNKKFARQHIIPLQNVKIENMEDDNDTLFGLQIRTPTKSFAVYAASLNEKNEWINHINMCIKDLLDKTGNAPISEHAAVWIPDNVSNVCMHCKKTTFNVINRKHHCRNCGQIVCGACSKNTHLMLNISSKPVRVCDGCYEQLSVKPPNNTQSNNNGADTSDSDGEGLHSKDSNYRESGRSLEDLDDLREKPTFYSEIKETTTDPIQPW